MRDLYKHSRSGEIYELLCVSEQSETHEKLAVYKKLKASEADSNIIWARPLDNFMGNVYVDGQFVPRFQKVKGL